MLAISKEIQKYRQNGLKGVIGTIISTSGSTYQKTGAKCFIGEDGRITGLLSGGCVEGDLKEYVKEVLNTGVPQTVHYNFQDEGDLVWGLGLGCNGKMNIFLEPYIPGDDLQKAEKIDSYFSNVLRKPLHSITIVDSSKKSLIGLKWVIDPEEPILQQITFKEIEKNYTENRFNQENRLSYIGGEHNLEVFYEYTAPIPQLTIFGAGPDAIPLVRLAKTLNWHVTVLDYRPAFVTSENFPEADELIVYPAGSVPNIQINRNTYIVLMTHNFIQDQAILEDIIHSEAAYIGLLGPRKRTNEIISTSKNLLNNPMLREIHSPVGLDIGSKTPEEIAFSIIAEIMITYRGGTGLRLTELTNLPMINRESGVLL
ncbi:xanthine dehydrogenase [Bacillus sp. M6-12]|uniref:XdhC family protein n=1 Tax=Bacillus sp. M6-12 TaxID=2054166 RepID=UPI000C778A49|nr:XdhC/CoxI family protein [Bacillus sp. M6-12]PLS16017.1 xanthine dehydrogenase [Bacillus sp. M6-12]